MTSPSNHEETVQYFRDHQFHGLNSSDVIILPQEELPVIDPRREKSFARVPAGFSSVPTGGGAIRLMQRHADLFRQRGIRHVYTHQVDNPLAPIGDPD